MMGMLCSEMGNLVIICNEVSSLYTVSGSVLDLTDEPGRSRSSRQLHLQVTFHVCRAVRPWDAKLGIAGFETWRC